MFLTIADITILILGALLVIIALSMIKIVPQGYNILLNVLVGSFGR